ncbi:MAG: hypothetical protein RSA89_02130, partial [Raoultibacter sp.]
EFFKGKVTMTADGGNDKSDILKSMSRLASGSDAYNWWERSCNPETITSFVICSTYGNPGHGNDPSVAWGIVLGFSI